MFAETLENPQYFTWPIPEIQSITLSSSRENLWASIINNFSEEFQIRILELFCHKPYYASYFFLNASMYLFKEWSFYSKIIWTHEELLFVSAFRG